MKSNNGGMACVVVNLGDAPEPVEINFEGMSGEVAIATPFQPDRNATLPVRLSIPPHQLAVVVKR
jgi:hypothetical protein